MDVHVDHKQTSGYNENTVLMPQFLTLHEVKFSGSHKAESLCKCLQWLKIVLQVIYIIMLLYLVSFASWITDKSPFTESLGVYSLHNKQVCKRREKYTGDQVTPWYL